MTKKQPAKKNGTSGGSSGKDLIKQAHGGALLRGGVKGHKGSLGYPPSKVREAARKSFAERLHVLGAIVDDEDERTSDRIGAMKLLSDTGGVDKIALTIDEQPEQEMTPERVAGLFAQLQNIKTVQQLEKLLIGAAKKQVGG